MVEEKVYSGWLKIYKRRIGNKTYEILKNHDAVAIFLMNTQKEVLMVKQFRPAQMKETLEIPAGVLDIEGETLESCAIRELKEETGIILSENSLKKMVSYKPMMGFSNSTMHMFMAMVDKNSLVVDNMMQDEDVTDCLWVSIERLAELIAKEEVYDSKTLMAYYYFMSQGIKGFA